MQKQGLDLSPLTQRPITWPSPSFKAAVHRPTFQRGDLLHRVNECDRSHSVTSCGSLLHDLFISAEHAHENIHPSAQSGTFSAMLGLALPEELLLDIARCRLRCRICYSHYYISCDLSAPPLNILPNSPTLSHIPMALSSRCSISREAPQDI